MINPDLLKKVAKKIDDMVDWVKITKKPVMGNVLEIADNYIFPYGLAYLNEKWGDKIPQQYVDEIEAALQCFVDGDYQGVLLVLPEGLDEAIDIKFLPDDMESIFLATNFNALVLAIKYYAAKVVAKQKAEGADPADLGEPASDEVTDVEFEDPETTDPEPGADDEPAAE